MGRKKGQQQRVKGNVLPSSSGRSADLLARESVNAGLGIFRSLPSLALGSLPELAGLDSISNIEFRTVLKKLYKRDVTTKLKALAEFYSLCESAEQHDVLEMLPYWPRIFNRLFEDNERRVREKTQKAMHAVVSAAGKNLALQLKNLMGCWFVSQRDSYSPAAMSAEAGINEAFSGEKKINAYVFCREDILSCISSYVFAPQAKRDKSTEEGDNNYRMVAACLEALSLYIQTVVYHKPLKGEIETFLDNSCFWKFQKHSSPSVRAGYYSVLESLCIISPNLANAHSTELCRSIFHRLDENNILVCKALYAAAVAATAKCDSWYDKIDVQKGLLSGLRNSFKAGCYGLSAYILPTLLPIFASLPFDSETLKVFTKLFEMLRLFITQESTMQSKCNTELAVASYMEVVKLSVKRLSDDIIDLEIIKPFCNSLVTDELLATIKASWSPGSSRFMTHSVFDIIPPVIRNWESRLSDTTVVFHTLLTTFWAELSALVQKECYDPENPTATDRAGAFLHCLLHQGKGVRTRRSVQFEDDDTIYPNITRTEGRERVECDVAKEWICSRVNKIVFDCNLLFPLKVEKNMLILQKNLYENLGTETLYSELSNSLDIDVNGNSRPIDKVKVFLNSSLVPALCPIIEKFSSDGEVLEISCAILSNVIRNCQVGTEFPCDLSLFTSSETPAFMTVLLQLVSDLLSTADYKTGPWLCSLINNNSLFHSLEIFKSVSRHAVSGRPSSLSEAPIGSLDSEKCWKLLENLITVSYCDEAGSKFHFCDPNLCSDIIDFISTLVNELSDNPDHFELAIIRFVNIMKAFMVESKSNEHLWQKLLTDLFQQYFVANDPVTILQLFETLFTCAAQGIAPFAHIELDKHLRSFGLWISQRMIQKRKPDEFDDFVEDAKVMVLKILQSLDDSDCILTFLDAFLPSPQDWNQVRNFDVSSVKIDCTNCIILLSSRIESHVIDVIDAFTKIIVKAVPCINFVCENFIWRDCSGYLRFVEESIVCCAISNQRSTTFDDAPCEIKKAVLSEVIRKSLAYGNLWGYSLRTLVSSFDERFSDVIFDQFYSSFERSELAAPLYQTMLLLIENISDDKVIELLKRISEKLVTYDSDETSVSDIFALSFGLNAVCSLEDDRKSEILSTYHALVLKWKRGNICEFLDDESDVFKVELIMLKNAVARFYSYLINHQPDSLCEDDWDFIQCALLAWIESVAKYQWDNRENRPAVLELANGAFKLLQVVINFMSSSTAINDPTIPSSLTSEWSGFFSNAIYTSLVKIFIHIKSSTVSVPLLCELCNCLKHVSPDSIFASVSDLKPKLTANSTLPDDVQTLVNHLCSSFTNNMDFPGDKQYSMIIISMSYNLLVKILDRLTTSESDHAPDEIWNVIRRLSVEVAGSFEAEDIEAPKSSTVHSDDSDFDEEDDLAMTVNTTIADTVELNAVSVLQYLLLWRIAIKLTKFINPEKKYTYVNSIMKQSSPNITEDVLPHLFKIMIGKTTHFRVNPNLLTKEKLDFEFIQHIAACLYKEFLLEMPAASRVWFNDLTKAVRSRVDEFTACYVSPVLIENEFKAIRATAAQQNKDGMEISAKPGAREVHASYQLNELKMEIAVCLAPNHPLGPITVNTEKRAGVVVGQWRYWILQITSFLQYQNGGIIDGLLMWKEKVNKKFEGMEECMICFSLVHGSSQNLPKLKCKTCKKKYHAQCLYKWFDTSNNSTCPLCRSPMIFR